MSRFLAVISSFLIMLCLGGVYAWSIFVPMLKKQLNFSTSQTQLIVGLTFGVFASSMIFAGKLEKRFGPRPIALAGGIFLFMGYYLAYMSGGDFTLLCFAIGGLCGLGTGCGYVCCLVTPAKNFPDNKGLATGVAVGGFGAGAILLTTIVKGLLASNPDTTVLELFKFIGLVYGAIILVCSLFLSYDKSGQITAVMAEESFVFSDIRFIILFVTMFAGTFAGLLILGNAKPIALSLGYSEGIATFSITLLAIGNMTGRVLWGWVLDKIGVDKTLFISYLILLGATIMISFMAPSEMLLNVVLVFVGLGFSANMVMFASKTAQIYGVNKLGIIYPYVFLAYGIAGVIGPFVGGWLFDINQNYSLALMISTIMTVIALILYQSTLKKINATAKI
jgi:OFA family oxalate/formate antiporter-like MFS transporter